MPYHRLSTAKIARLVGCHPNTVRLYEAWGYISPVPRSPARYRLYTTDHLYQMRLAWCVMNSPWPGRSIRRSGVHVVRRASGGDLPGALEEAHQHLELVRAEQQRAEEAADAVEQWANGKIPSPLIHPLRIGEAARLLNLTVDILHNWETNGLLQTQRDPHNGYRLYGAAEILRLRIIRMLRLAGYSTMAILRMLLQLEEGNMQSARQVLDTPRSDEDILYASDRWLSTLADQEQRACRMIDLLKEWIEKSGE